MGRSRMMSTVTCVECASDSKAISTASVLATYEAEDVETLAVSLTSGKDELGAAQAGDW